MTKFVHVQAEEPDDNVKHWVARYDHREDQPRVVGNALIFIEAETFVRVVLPLSSYTKILLEDVKPEEK
jgi:hypothetical protein